MSSFLSVYGSLTFPPGALARWQAAPLGVTQPDESGGEGIFDGGNDLDSVAEVLASDVDSGVFVRFIVAGETLHLRAVLEDDDWSLWCGRIFALASAAATLGARGAFETEDDGMYSGRLVVDGRRAVYEPRSPKHPDARDHAGRQDMERIWAEVMQAREVALEQARIKAAEKRAAKKATKKAAKKATKKVAKKATKKVAKKVAKKAVRRGG